MNAYEILGVQPNATEEEVKNAYRKLAQKYSGPEYEESLMKEQAEAEMEKINAAFDEIMANLRAGQQGTADSDFQAKSQQGQTGGTVGRWAEIRSLINAGRVDEAMAQLNAIPNGAAQAEWNFLMGSAFYYKGWMNEAFQYFSAACRLAPGNREYEAALRNLQNAQSGRMPGNPYGSYGAPGGQAMSCSCCDICAAWMCMDACCSCCGGF